MPINACVIGGTGGIGTALLQALAGDPAVGRVYAASRMPVNASDKVIPLRCDITDEASIAAAAAQISAADMPLHLIIVATGMLHDAALQPEKSAKMQTGDAYARAFEINATGPALVGKHFLPLMPRVGRTVFAALSARVSSISDNRLGGWHAYRASKAALNMIVRNFAIEIAVRNAEALAVTLHPGTVDTPLSAPFQRGVVADKLFTADYSADCLLNVIDGLQPSDSGQLFAWDGARIAY